MPYLTFSEVIESYPFGNPYTMLVHHNPNWWSQILDHDLGDPIKLKFDQNIRDAMPENIHRGKGIYMFCLEPDYPISDEVLSKHLLYVGRVQAGTTNYNFFRRFLKYVRSIGNRAIARNTMRLTNLWPNHTYVYYFELSEKSDQDIVDIEKNIFNNIVPPLNEELHGEARLTRRLY
ncbi:MAG: hypothetical protein AAGC64_12810 [Bacteroidota bacterium]